MTNGHGRANAAETVQTYYEALRNGAPLAPYFAAGDDVVKCGVFSRRVGGDAVASGLAEQGERTDDWRVDSRDLQVVQRGDGYARFADRATLAWRDRERDARYEFDARWTGVLEHGRDPAAGPGDSTDGSGAPPEDADAPPESAGALTDGSDATGPPGDWRFVAMHVSTAEER